MRHKKEKKRVGGKCCAESDELSRSGVLEEIQHVYNAALILRRAIQSLQPITPFQLSLPICQRSDEEKIDAHVSCTIFSHG